MDTTSIILLLLILLAVVVTTVLFYNHSILLRTTLNQLNQHTFGLNTTLIQHREAVDKMPKNFDQVIRNELEHGLSATVQSINGLQINLQHTHTAFQSLFQNIPHLDQMPEWLSEVKDTVKPLQSMALGVQNLDKEVFQRYSKFVDSKIELESAFGEVSKLIGEWTNQSDIEREEFKRLVADNISNLSLQTTQLREALTEIQLFSANNNDLFKGLGLHLPKVIQNLGDLTDQISRYTQKSEETANRTSQLITAWEQRASNQQWIIWVFTGLSMVNVLILLILVLKK